MVRKGEEGQEIGYRAQNTLLGSIYSQLGTAVGYEVYERVQCFPMQTLILALDVNHVHFVSLDVEGTVYIQYCIALSKILYSEKTLMNLLLSFSIHTMHDRG